VHPRNPWVWKDPRAAVLLPFWRRALGPRLAAVVVFRNPVEVAESLQRRHEVPLSFGVALWERYNRLLLAHSAGLAVLVTGYDELVRDPLRWTGAVGDFLTGVGMDVSPVDRQEVAGFVDAEMRHSTRGRADVEAVSPGALAVYDALEAARGASGAFVPPELDPEGSWVTEQLDTVGPGTALAWHPPPGATATGGEGRA